ncbi:MAG: hypothetical protein QXZ13_03690 [Candidatus Diapherotrites archaeon]
MQILAETGIALKTALNTKNIKQTQEEIDPLAIEAYRLSLNNPTIPTQEELTRIKKEKEQLKTKIAIKLFLSQITDPKIKQILLEELKKMI